VNHGHPWLPKVYMSLLYTFSSSILSFIPNGKLLPLYISFVSCSCTFTIHVWFYKLCIVMLCRLLEFTCYIVDSDRSSLLCFFILYKYSFFISRAQK
jgi:hypothetical protein